MRPSVVHFASSRVHVPAANTAAVVTLAAVAGRRNVVYQVAASYSATPTGGRLTITDGGVTVLDVGISAGGLTNLVLDPGLAGGPNAEVVATLAAGGSGIIGRLNVVATVE